VTAIAAGVRSPGPTEGLKVGRFSKAGAFWFLHITGWLTFGTWMTVWGLQSWGLETTLINKGFLVATGLILTFFFPVLFRRWSRNSPPLFALLVGGTALLGAVLWTEVYEIFRDMVAGDGLHLVPLSVGTLLVNALALLTWSLLYLAIDGWFALNAERLRAARAETLAHEAQLRALRSQLEPHFLFNTLNAITTLVETGDRVRALEMIGSLSNFLRATLATMDSPMVSLAKELDLVSRYLAIQQVRFGDRLRLRVDVDREILDGQVPALILQPLVENALKHGLLPREEGGSLSLAAHRKGELLEIAVVDDGPGLPKTGLLRGVGLRNTEARLREVYGSRAEFSLTPGPAGGLAAILRIPLERGTSR
jgi:two-component system LytT family sensor kinase